MEVVRVYIILLTIQKSILKIIKTKTTLPVIIRLS